jgi:SAM-dependent methyltransferase
VRGEHIEYLACPECKSSLRVSRVQKGTEELVESGQLKCLGCHKEYDIIRHIPRFVPFQNYAASFGIEWNRHARSQYDSYSGAKLSEKRFFEETSWPRKMEGECILEVGSGSGRFTEQAASTGAMVVSMDYSCAVEANFVSNGKKGNVFIVQGDIYRMPFKENYFDKLFCFGMLQHTPDARGAFMMLPPYLKSGGNLVIDVYRKFDGLRQSLNTKYWVRPVTKRANPEKLYLWCKKYVEFMWPLAKIIHKLPKGKSINWKLLVADRIGIAGLSEEIAKEWTILDTFDMLSPAYDSPQKLQTVRKWFEDAGLADIKVHYGWNGIEGHGRRP